MLSMEHNNLISCPKELPNIKLPHSDECDNPFLNPSDSEEESIEDEESCGEEEESSETTLWQVI